jgi:hypothetical protein
MIKQASNKVQTLIPSCDKDEKIKTQINFIPLNKERYDKYMSSLSEFKRNKIVSHSDISGKLLFEQCLAPNSDGVYIYNALIDGVQVKEIKDKQEAVKFLVGLEDVDTANEIETKMRGQSVLTDEEEKN